MHGNPEFSGKLQTIEIYTPHRDNAGKFIGLNHEGIFYDPEALVEPIRMTRTLERISGFEEGEPYTFIECVQTIYPDQRVRAKPVVAGTVIPYKVPNMYGRPWAKIWEEYHEKGMQRPHRRRNSSSSTEHRAHLPTADRPCSDAHWLGVGEHAGFSCASGCPLAPPPQGGAPTFRTGVNIVRVDVIVADEKGKPVTDLAKDEFEIVEDGRPQTIELFRHIRIDGTSPWRHIPVRC